MKLIDNINDLLGDDIKKSVQSGARLKIAASCFSIYAYEALKRELESVESFEFIFTSPSFMPDEVTDAAKKERREFHIPKSDTDRSFYGTEFEVQLKNKLTQRAIARECADWMRRKAKFRSNSGAAPMQQFAAVQADAKATVPNAVYMPLHGFTAVDLGYQRGNAVSNIVNKFDEPANTGVFLSLFDQIWADPDKLKDVTSLVCGKRSANPPCADDVGVLRALYAKAASVGADAAVSPGAADLQLCGSSDARSRCLSGSSRSNTSFR